MVLLALQWLGAGTSSSDAPQPSASLSGEPLISARGDDCLSHLRILQQPAPFRLPANAGCPEPKEKPPE